jgi:hypothetical protein
MEWTGKVSVHLKSSRFPYLAAFPVIILDFFYIYTRDHHRSVSVQINEAGTISAVRLLTSLSFFF